MANSGIDKILFTPITPYRTGMLPVGGLQTLHWEGSGNPKGEAVLLLDGGTGSGTSPRQRRFFDPAHYRIVLFDQRSAGKSTSLREYRENTTPLLIADIEGLRVMLEIEQWLVFGGSWGSTLALAYCQVYPERCLGFVLRGIFLCGSSGIDWFLYGMGQFFPKPHAHFLAPLPAPECHDLLQAYRRQLFTDDPAVYAPASRAWSRYEACCLYLRPDQETICESTLDAVGLGNGRLEAHYFIHDCFMASDQLLQNVTRIAHLPVVIVQGRYDVVRPPMSAHHLHKVWPQARLESIDDAGHAALEPGTARALVAATEAFRRSHSSSSEQEVP
ncbi:MAG: prolyl aminopeptidase [Burkholderiaceae bacterium]